MKYAEIKKYDIANGTGVRVSLFVSGCRHQCKNCFNQIAWDFNYGKEFDLKVQKELIEALKYDYITGLSLLGGEPLEPENQRGLVSFLKKVKEVYPNKTIWCYSGFIFETEIKKGRAHIECTDELLSYLDVLVDGRFVEELKDITLKFRGSSNQRLIDVKASLEFEETILLKLE